MLKKYFGASWGHCSLCRRWLRLWEGNKRSGQKVTVAGSLCCDELRMSMFTDYDYVPKFSTRNITSSMYSGVFRILSKGPRSQILYPPTVPSNFLFLPFLFALFRLHSLPLPVPTSLPIAFPSLLCPAAFLSPSFPWTEFGVLYPEKFFLKFSM